MPVVLMLHGAGGNSRNAMRQAGLAAFADEMGFLVVAADGTPPRAELPPQFIANPQVWNDGSERGHAYARGVDDVAFLTAALDEVASHHAVDNARIYVTGFSNGASMAFRLAAALPSRIAAIGAVAGHPFACPNAGGRRVPAVCVCGTADPLLPLPGGDIHVPWVMSLSQPPYVESVGWWASCLGCDPVPRRCRWSAGVERLDWHAPETGAGRRHDPDRTGTTPDEGPPRGEPVVALYLIEGAGHVWPGGISFMPEVMVGSDPGTFLATEVLLSHLFRHSL